MLLCNDVDPVAVLGGEPPLFLSGDPDVLVGDGPTPVGVGGFGLQDHVPRNGGRFFAQEQPARIGLPLAQRPDLLDLGRVLVGIEASDQPLAVRVDDALEQLGADRGVGDRLSLEIGDRHLELHGVAREHPGIGLDADETRRGEDRDARRDGLGRAARVAELELGRDVDGPVELRQVRDHGARRAGAVESQVGALDLRPPALLLIDLGADQSLAHRPQSEGEVFEASRRRRVAGRERVAEADREVPGGSAGQIAHGQVDRDRRGRDELLPRRMDDAAHQRHAELFDAEASGEVAAARPGQEDLVHPELGLPRNRPGGLGDPGTVPGDRKLVFLLAPQVLDHERGRPLSFGDEREPRRDVPPQDVLHVHGFAGAQQRAVEDRVRGQEVAPVLGRDAEAPRLDSLVPGRVDEGQVVAELRRHEKSQLERIVPAPGVRIRDRKLRRPGDAVAIRLPLPQDLPRAVAHRDRRARGGARAVERRHPDQGRIDPPLEVDREVRDQDRRRHEHRLGRAEQRRAQDVAPDLDDVEAG